MHPFLQIRFFAIVLSLLMLAACLGCGSGFVIVEGQVTFDGQPIEQGSIVLEPADGTGAVAGGTIQNGKYLLGPDSKVTPGNKIVRITAMRATGKKIKAGPPAPDDAEVDEVLQIIPPKYNTQSTLTTQITAGKVTQNFDLKSP